VVERFVEIRLGWVYLRHEEIKMKNKKFLLLMICLMITYFPQALATTAGPNNPTAASDLGDNVGIWANPTNVYSSNNVYATITAPRRNLIDSDTLLATGFGFSIPSGATIDGIQVDVERKFAGTGGNVNDAGDNLWTGGSVKGSASASYSWSTTEAYVTYGGATAKWGTTWTPADINADDFGFGMQASVSAGALYSCVASVDHIRITVYYTEVVSDTTKPIVTLVQPPTPYYTNSPHINLTCNATDNVNLTNITLYTNYSGTWLVNQTKYFTTNGTAVFNLTNLSSKEFIWNCLASDNSSNTNWSTTNYTIIINNTYRAYQKLGSPTSPYDWLNEANQANYESVNQSDTRKWTTNLTTTDGQINAQIYIFNASYITDITKVATINFTWHGYGDNNSILTTNISAWNYTSASWVLVNETQFINRVDKNVTILLTINPSDFFNSTTKEVVFKIQSAAKTPYACDGYLENGECWYQATSEDSCNTVCSSHSGCVAGNWNDADYSVCMYFNGAPEASFTVAYSFAPYYFQEDVPLCYARDSTSQDCSAVPIEFARRLCVCNGVAGQIVDGLNTNTINLDIIVDTSINVNMNFPLNNSYYLTNDTIEFNCSAIDISNVKNLTLHTNTSGTWIAEYLNDTIGLYSDINYSINVLHQGTYQYYCEAYDIMNNRNITQNYTLRVGPYNCNESYPFIFIRPTNFNENINQTWNLIVQNNGLQCIVNHRCWYGYNNIITTYLVPPIWIQNNYTGLSLATTSYTNIFNSTAPGTYDINYTFNASANQDCIMTESFTFSYDTVPPNITLQIPINNSILSISDVNFTCRADDARNKVDNMSLWHNLTGVFGLNYSETNTGGGFQQLTKIYISQYNGYYNWTCSACDIIGNCANASYAFFTINNPCGYGWTNNWFECSNYCNLTINNNFRGYNITFNGTGKTSIFANLTNWKHIAIQNSCQLDIYRGGGFW
jgi:hypothetical protein